MAGTKVFISSTCYDLSVLRSELRNFITALGHEPIMSEYADILYDPRIHTHTSCINEVINCDLMVVIIGSRFGGKGVPQALDQVNIDLLQNASDDATFLSENSNISITQLEVLKAIENNIPIYTFVEKKVYYEHEVYEKNKNNTEIIKNIVFPAIDKQETAQYIFGFLNYIRLRSTGNYFFQFERLQDIQEVLKKQWSAYFQRLLIEQRSHNEEIKQIEHLNEQFESLKTAIISTIDSVDQREVANGIVRYRKMAEFLFGIKCEHKFLCSYNGSFNDLLQKQKIINVIDLESGELSEIFTTQRNRMVLPKTLFVLDNNTFFETKLHKDFLYDIETDWSTFKEIKSKSREYILDALRELTRPNMLIRYRQESIDEYIHKMASRL